MKRIALPVLSITAVAAATYSTINTTDVVSKPTQTDVGVIEEVSNTSHIITDVVAKYYDNVVSPIKFTPACTGGTTTFDVDGTTYTGTINVVQTHTDGLVRIGGDFSHGTFCFAVQPDSTTTGMIIVPSKRKCYLMNPTSVNEPITWQIVKTSEVMCMDMPTAEGGAVVTPTPTPVITTHTAVPMFNSKPDAKTVLLLDFVGGKIQDPLWNGGRVIDAKPANYTTDQIKTTFDVVAERYSMFNINVTTDVQKYLKAPVKNKMRVVLTTTNFIKGYSGYAYIGSLAKAGTGMFAPNIVCWTFVNMVSSAKSAGEVCAHELGHTFGLHHDGTFTTPYYSGQGRWATIMGSAFSKPVVQWSKGEYNRANNQQDDIAVITNTPGVGARTSPTATTSSGSMNITSIISKSTDVHVHSINVLKAGTATFQATPTMYSGVDVMMELKDVRNNTLATSNLTGRSDAFITWPVQTGTYHVCVRPSGDGDPKTTGYSSYGSVGGYVVAGGVK